MVYSKTKLFENELLDACEEPIMDDLLLLFCMAEAIAIPAVLVGVADGNDEIMLPTLLLLLPLPVVLDCFELVRMMG